MTKLTPYEKQIIALVIADATNKDIAKKYGITEQSVKNKIRLIFLKTETTSRISLLVKMVSDVLDDIAVEEHPEYSPTWEHLVERAVA